MLFRKEIDRSCTYCAHGTQLESGEILCIKKGVVSGEKPCWRFSYDPCKRIPIKAKPVDFQKYDEEDYSL